jgi:hypothetical protein
VPETYDRIAAAVENGDPIEETYSLRGKCALNELATFHATMSFVPDLMHDFLGNCLASVKIHGFRYCKIITKRDFASHLKF